MATKETIKLTNVLFGEKTFSAIEQNGVTGAGGIINVPELPTENILPDTFYRITATEETAEVYVCINRTVCTIGELIQTLGASFSYETHIVDTLPDIMVPLDQTTTPITGDIYIIRETGIGYLSMDGTSNNVVPVSVILSGVLGIEVTDKGWIASKDAIVATDANEVYCVAMEVLKETLWKYKDNEWIEFKPLTGLVLQAKTITENGTYTVDDGYDALGKVVVEVPEPTSKYQTKTITENGIFTADAGYDALGKITVAVPNTLYDYTNNNITHIADYTFYNTNFLRSFTSTSVTSIGNWAFFNCSSLTSVTIPANVTSIGREAFSNCHNLTSVTIPARVTSIGGSAFGNCSSLTNISVDENNTAFKSIDGNLYSKDGTTLIQYAIGKTDTEFTVPDSVTSIGGSALFNCWRLISVIISDGVTNIVGSAFMYCTSLTSVTIPASVTSIGYGIFYGCKKLTTINYTGTVAQWNAIEFGTDWNKNTGNYTIHCTDGDITKS